MNKWTLACVLQFLIAPIQLLLGECNTKDALEEYQWSSAEGSREEMDLPVKEAVNYSGLQEMSFSSRDGMSDQEMELDYCLEESCYCSSAPSFLSRLDPTLKLRIAAFWPSSERFNGIYGDSMPCYQIEAGGTFLDCYQGWINVDWLNKRGKSEHLHYLTRVKILNVSLGVGIMHPLTCSFSAYAGIGPSFGTVFVHNRHTREHKNETKFAWGLVVKSGLIYQINCRFFVDLFIDYLYQPSTFRTHVNIGGLKTGIGIGTHF